MNRKNSLFYLTTLITLLLFYSCSKSNSKREEEEPRTFVRINVDNQVYEYFDDNVKRQHFTSDFANTGGHLFDTAAADLQGKPGFFISYSGPIGKIEGDFWITWGTWDKFSFSRSTSPDSWTPTLNIDPNKNRFSVTQISNDKKSWSGDFYHEVTNSLGEIKIIKGTYFIVDD